MKSSSRSLLLASWVSVFGLVACSPDTNGTASTSNAEGGGDAATTGATSPTTTTGGDGDGDGDGDTTSSNGGSTSSDGGSTSGDGGSTSDGGAGPGSGGQGVGGDPSGNGGSGTGGDAVSSAATGSADADGDGFTIDEGDCDDTRGDINPDATEICNTRDDDCDDAVDEGFDADGDTWFTCLGDCDDGNAAVNPGQTEIGPNGLDDDCDGDTDGPFLDDDGDGYTEAEGDCNDEDENVSPGSIEFPDNDVDDDCDGTTDEALQPCDGALNPNDAMDYGRAIGLCNGELLSASFVSGVAAGRTITGAYGTNGSVLNRPAEGSSFIHLSSGRADNSNKNAGFAFDGSLGFGRTCLESPHPAPLGDPPGSCASADPTWVCDKTELSLQIRVPQNAQSFTFDFQFYSAEYSAYRCSAFDDTFLALLASQAFNGNISFDAAGNVMSVNTGFFDICFDDLSPSPPNICTTNPVATLASTGFDANTAGATVPLTTTAPVVPGEIITLRFIIFDEADERLDSSVLIDNFRWSLSPSDGPGTEPTN